MANLAVLPAIPAQGTHHRPVMEQAALIFLAERPDLTPAMVLSAGPSPLSAELASALAAVQGTPLRCVPG